METPYVIAIVVLSVFAVVAIAAAIWGGVRHSKTKKKKRELEEYYKNPAPLSYDYYDSSAPGSEAAPTVPKAGDGEITGNYKPD